MNALRATLLFSLLGLVTLSAQNPIIIGQIRGDRYVSPTGEFNVEIPVLPELGGSITDTPSVVTFQDAFTLHASIACFKMDATQRWERDTRGAKDYLVWFFSNFVQDDFRQRFPDSRIQSARFFPSVMHGALLVYNVLPGGTMFPDRVAFSDPELVPVAKRGNLVFAHNEHIYVISTELAERVIQARTWQKTAAEEDEILRLRVFDILKDMTFSVPAPDPSAGLAAEAK